MNYVEKPKKMFSNRFKCLGPKCLFRAISIIEILNHFGLGDSLGLSVIAMPADIDI